MQLSNLVRIAMIVTLTCMSGVALAEKSIEIHCSDSKGSSLTVYAPSALQFAESPGSAVYWGPAHGEVGNTEIVMGCDVTNEDRSLQLDHQFSNPHIKCSDSLILSYTPTATLYRSSDLPGKPLVARVEEVTRWHDPFPLTTMVCDQ